jgi:hypothetical protein
MNDSEGERMPTTHRHFRHIEAPNGAGTLYDGERIFAQVAYTLRVLQEIIGTRHWTGASAEKGTLQISGGFSVTSGSLPFDGDHLTLKLEDGRSIPFLVVGHGPDYTIDPTATLTSTGHA